MRFLEKIARNYIKKTETKSADTIKENRVKEEHYRRVEQTAEKLLKDYVDDYAKSFDLNPRFKVGDRLIVNKYSIKCDSRNRWDSGATILCNEITDRVIFVTVDKVYVTYSYAHDIIENYISRIEYDTLETRIKEGSLIEFYNRYLTKQFLSDSEFDNFGLYTNILFTTEDESDFNPTWGLNEFAFHKDDSKEAAITENLWNWEMDLVSREKNIREERKTWEKERNSVSLIKYTYS